MNAAIQTIMEKTVPARSSLEERSFALSEVKNIVVSVMTLMLATAAVLYCVMIGAKMAQCLKRRLI